MGEIHKKKNKTPFKSMHQKAACYSSRLSPQFLKVGGEDSCHNIASLGYNTASLGYKKPHLNKQTNISQVRKTAMTQIHK